MNVIAAFGIDRGIGKNGHIPWPDNYGDKKFFHDQTCATINNIPNLLIVGRITYEEMCGINRKKRVFAVISKTMESHPSLIDPESNDTYDYTNNNTFIFRSFDAAVAFGQKQMFNRKIGKIFVCGGQEVYKQAINHPFTTQLTTSIIPFEYDYDRYFPDIDGTIWSQSETGFTKQWVYKVYKKNDIVNGGENQYLELAKKIIDTGYIKNNRTGINTISLFSQHLTYELMNNAGKPVIPLLTTKTTPFRIIYEELLWFIAGKTSAKPLQEKNIHIWDGNSTRSFLDSRGLPYPEGELGPVYGAQWRHFGGVYSYNTSSNDVYLENEADYKVGDKKGYTLLPAAKMTGGIDQLQQVINSIKSDPFGRRHVVSAWNPIDLDKMALPPCHMLFVFVVEPEHTNNNTSSNNNNNSSNNNKITPKYLNISVHMRSNDIFLGHPFNIASYATLAHMVAHLTGLCAKRLAITMDDCHIYENHIDAMKEQISRTPFAFPEITIDKKVKTIDEFDSSSVKIENYNHWNMIKAPMAV